LFVAGGLSGVPTSSSDYFDKFSYHFCEEGFKFSGLFVTLAFDPAFVSDLAPGIFKRNLILSDFSSPLAPVRNS
jgi:hypothetical protein